MRNLHEVPIFPNLKMEHIPLCIILIIHQHFMIWWYIRGPFHAFVRLMIYRPQETIQNKPMFFVPVFLTHCQTCRMSIVYPCSFVCFVWCWSYDNKAWWYTLLLLATGLSLINYVANSCISVDQGSNKNHSPAYNFAPTVTKFCVMWEGLSLPHDTKFGNCRCKIVDSRLFPSWSLIHGLHWSGLIKVFFSFYLTF